MSKVGLSVLVSIFMLVGCGSDKDEINPKKLEVALNEYYKSSASECVKLIDLGFWFPRKITLEEYNKEPKVIDVLVQNKILSATNSTAIKIEWVKQPKVKGKITYGDGRIPKEIEVEGKKLDLTEKGKRIFSEEYHPSQTRRKSGALCVGKYEVLKIDNYTKKTDHGLLTADVLFTRKPVVTIPGLVEVLNKDKKNLIYRDLIKKLETNSQKKETLIFTEMKGWLLEKEYNRLGE